MARISEREKRKEIILAWQRDPLVAHKQVFDKLVLWEMQEEVLQSVWRNRRTAVKSGNTVGKSRIAAECALLWLITHNPSKVITTAPTWTQIEDILWKEIAELRMRSRIALPEPKMTGIDLAPDWFARGISTNEVNRMQGFHSPHLLVIIDEALGVEKMMWEAIEGLMPERILAIGNPLSPEGEFYKCFGSPLWHKVTISCVDAVHWQAEHGAIPGLVTLEWCEERKQEWGYNSPLYQARVLGEFPTLGTDTLIPPAWWDRCREARQEPVQEDGVVIQACDPARYGDDKTVMVERQGNSVLDVQIYEKQSLVRTAKMLANRYAVLKPDSNVVDDDGLGGGVTDMLEDQCIPVHRFHNGSSCRAIDHNKFRNLRSQFYWILARKMEHGEIDLSRVPQREFDIMKAQGSAIKWKLNAYGQIEIESKDHMKARALPSPDAADALMMSEYGYFMGRQADIREWKWR